MMSLVTMAVDVGIGFVFLNLFEGFTMDASALDTLVKQRRSIRGYKKKPVSQDLIVEIIAVAKGAPSSMNTQP